MFRSCGILPFGLLMNLEWHASVGGAGTLNFMNNLQFIEMWSAVGLAFKKNGQVDDREHYIEPWAWSCEKQTICHNLLWNCELISLPNIHLWRRVDMFLCSVKQKRLLLQSKELINVGLIGEREKFVTGIQHGGVDLLAPEEFEKETGGYQSGDEGGTEPSLNVGIDIQFKDPEARLSKSKEFRSKKRKRVLSNDVQLYVLATLATSIWLS
jgi:hypothetical protein